MKYETLEQHNNKQYTLRCHLPGHFSYSLVNQRPPERNLKYAAREYKENFESFIPRRGLNQANLKLSMKSIHTVDVRSAINNYSTTANRPHTIDGSEHELPRRRRTPLAPFVSGWCHITRMSRINPEIQDICPNCGISRRDVHHLFNCLGNRSSNIPSYRH